MRLSTFSALRRDLEHVKYQVNSSIFVSADWNKVHTGCTFLHT
jgi:hypothetical protein